MNTEKDLLELLTKNVDDWQFGDYVASHSSGLVWWIANGFSSFRIYQSKFGKPHLGYWNRLKLWKWLEEAKRIQYINRLKCAASAE